MIRFILLSALSGFIVAYALTGALQPALAAAGVQAILLRIALALQAGIPALPRLIADAEPAAPQLATAGR